MKLIEELHKALESSDQQYALFLCSEIIRDTDYPRALKAYAKDIHNRFSATTRFRRENNRNKRLLYGAYFESFERRPFADTYVKTIAFYLPQFHQIPENDQWWGHGFTEWSNTSASISRYDGHYQPRVPHATIGYYDLGEVAVLEAQAELARQANIDAFCFYYYWFSGKRLLDKPLANLNSHPGINIDFVVCWANENWTRAWDGLENDVLIRQNYSPGWDVEFIEDVSKYFWDARYVRLNGRPILIVYKLLDIPDFASAVETWRSWCRLNGVGEISVWAVFNLTFKEVDVSCIDRFVEFPPWQVGALNKLDGGPLNPQVADFHLYDYKALTDSIAKGMSVADQLDFSLYRTAMMGWDNAARRKDGFSTWVNFSCHDFYSWCREIWQYTVERFPHEERFIFVNAWNEWGEGTYLEPDVRFGFACINTLSRALTGLPFEPRPIIFVDSASPSVVAKEAKEDKHVMLAVHIHLHYLDALDEICSYLKNIHHPFDLYLTITSPRAKKIVSDILGKLIMAQKTWIIVVPNIGRDIGPFVIELKDSLFNYDFVLHLHGKRSGTVWWGHLWREYLLNHCLGSPQHVDHILQRFGDDPELGLISPPIYPPLVNHANWGGDSHKEWCQLFLDQIVVSSGNVPSLPPKPHFPAGNFFWARVEALKPLFDMNLTYWDFEEERVSGDYRLEHVIERIWPYSVGSNGYSYQTCIRSGANAQTSQTKRRLCVYVSYSDASILGPEALHYIQSLSDFVDTFIIVSNSPIEKSQQESLSCLCSRLLFRDNTGFDFGAWRDALTDIGYEELADYDELILTNSSCLGPFVPWQNVFAAMEKGDKDFWGLTIFPETRNSDRPEAQHMVNRTIPRHIQSFFMVFRKHVVASSAFQGFWISIEDESELLHAVVRYETQLTKLLESHGFTYAAYCKGHEAMQDHNQSMNYNAIYNQPYEMLILGSPVIKNKFDAMWPGQIPLLKEYVASTNYYPSSIAARWH